MFIDNINNIHQKDKKGDTSLDLSYGNEGIHQAVRFLIRTSKAKNGSTPLHVAVQTNQFQIFKLIFEVAKYKNSKDKQGNTPLHVAACLGNIEIFKFIFEEMQKVQNENPKNFNGRTPLHNASQAGHLEICSFIF